jgi:hypothetical protein
MESLIEMYKLSALLEYTMVKDMVADETRKPYQKYVNEEHIDEASVSDFLSSTDLMTTVTRKNDGPLLRPLVDIMIDQNVNFGIDYPDEVADHIVELAEERESNTPPAMHISLHKEVCAAYDHQDTQQACYEVQADNNEAKTKRLINDFYTQMANLSMSRSGGHLGRSCIGLSLKHGLTIIESGIFNASTGICK